MPASEMGGKAANLLKLISIVNVKPFVVITVEEIEKIRTGQVFPKSVHDRLETLSPALTYAVRSSGVNEDSTDKSWAGIFLTVLNVRYKDIPDAIRQCIVSSTTNESASAYAKMHNAAIGGFAIIVQEMVDASYAGVLFTTDPLGSSGMVVEAVTGNAEKLVSGRVQPSRYHLHQNDSSIIAETITSEVELSREQLDRLFRVGEGLRNHLGFEVDIEWAFDQNNILYVNQARPITAITQALDETALAKKSAEQILEKNALRIQKLGGKLETDILSNQNIAELLGSSPTRMAHGLFRYIFADGEGAIKTGRNEMGYEIATELDEGFHLLIAGKPMVSVIRDAFTYRIGGIPLDDYCILVNDYLARIRTDESLANYPEVVLYEQDPTDEYLLRLFGPEKTALYAKAYADFFSGIRVQETGLSDAFENKFVPEWHALVESLQPSGEMSLHEAVTQYRAMCDHLRTDACRSFVKVTRLGFFAFSRLRAKLRSRFDRETADDYLNALTGYPDVDRSPNYQFSLALYGLRTGTTTLEAVSKTFGHLAVHELEISLVRYRDRPDLLNKLSQQSESPVTRHEERKKQYMSAKSALNDTELEQEVEIARRYLALREIAKFEYLKGYDILRQLAVQIGKELGWNDLMIFNLDPTEVFRLVDDATSLHEAAKTAEFERKLYRSVSIPNILFGERLDEIGHSHMSDDTILRGIGVTSYSTEGVCVVIDNLDDESAISQILPGMILVTENTDPAWSPIIASLGKTGGLVTEVGGLLAHTAICAREQGIAAVLNVPNARKRLRTGTRVRVDGRNGLVEVTGPAPE